MFSDKRPPMYFPIDLKDSPKIQISWPKVCWGGGALACLASLNVPPIQDEVFSLVSEIPTLFQPAPLPRSPFFPEIAAASPKEKSALLNKQADFDLKKGMGGLGITVESGFSELGVTVTNIAGTSSFKDEKQIKLENGKVGNLNRIIEVEGKEVHSPQDLIDSISSCRPGDKINVVVGYTRGGIRSITVNVGIQPPFFGVIATPGKTRGVFVSNIVPDSPADVFGLRRGDELVSIATARGRKIPIGEYSDFRDFVTDYRNAPGDSFLITVKQGKNSKTIKAIFVGSSDYFKRAYKQGGNLIYNSLLRNTRV